MLILRDEIRVITRVVVVKIAFIGGYAKTPVMCLWNPQQRMTMESCVTRYRYRWTIGIVASTQAGSDEPEAWIEALGLARSHGGGLGGDA